MDSSQTKDSADYPLVYNQLCNGLQKSKLLTKDLGDTLSMELLDHLVAGHDATGIIITYLIYELSRHPSLQKSLRHELQTSLHTKPTNLAQTLETLPLLDATLTETLRLYPANPGPWPRISLSTIKLGPYPNIPKGTIISASAYSLHRNSEVFPHPEEWRPERWLAISEMQRKEMMKWFWGFGSGARMCIGKDLGVYSEY